MSDTEQALPARTFVFLTISKTARRLGVSRYYVRKMIADGDLLTVTIAGRLLVTEASVDAAATAILQQLEPYAAVA